MPNYRRWYVPGGTYFFTVVSHHRRHILNTDLARPLLRQAFATEIEATPFSLEAILLLPDHLHTIWTLPDGDTAYPDRWKRIKRRFSEEYLARGGTEGDVSESQRARNERGVWQPRYWEHVVRDEVDFKRCLDYVHWNPVKHGLATRVRDYPWSSFFKWVDLGEYDINWGEGEVPDVTGAEWD